MDAAELLLLLLLVSTEPEGDRPQTSTGDSLFLLLLQLLTAATVELLIVFVAVAPVAAGEQPERTAALSQDNPCNEEEESRAAEGAVADSAACFR